MKNRVLIALAASAVLAGCPMLRADDDSHAADKQFVKEVMQDAMAQQAYNELAAKISKRKEVHKYAGVLIPGYEKMQHQILDLAKAHHYDLDEKLTDDQKNLKEKLQNLQGDKFDGTFIDNQLKDLESLHNKLVDAAKDLKDVDIRKFAAVEADDVKMHLDDAYKVHGELVNDMKK